MTRFKIEYEQEDGWTDIIFPTPLYKMRCCDCDLVHDLQFHIFKRGKTRKDGTYLVQEIKEKSLIVGFSARRNTRSTGQSRRHRDR
jgi:hypothetical protein